MKKKDIIFIVGFAVILAIAYFIYTSMSKVGNTVKVYYHNECIDTVNIDKDGYYTYKGDEGEFHLEVKDGSYHAADVDCPNHDCENVGWVKIGSRTNIICVPNSIYISQESDAESFE